MTVATRRHRRKGLVQDRVARSSPTGEAQTAEPILEPPAIDAAVVPVEFVIVGDPEPDDDLVGGIVFDDLVDARDREVVDALVMTALAATGTGGWKRAVRLLQRAADHLRRSPLEHFMIDDVAVARDRAR